MTRLIILNGPSGVGKSTLAARLHAKIPGSVLIDIDELRRAIPEYRERRAESLRLSYELANNAVEEGLREGKDVLVDKNILDVQVLDTFVANAKRYGAEVYEFLLFIERATLRERADSRGYKPGGLLTPAAVDEHWTKADKLRSERKNMTVIDTTHLTPEEVFSVVNDKLSSHLIH